MKSLPLALVVAAAVPALANPDPFSDDYNRADQVAASASGAPCEECAECCAPERAPVQAGLGKEMHELVERARELHQDGRHEEAERVRAEIQRMMARAGGIAEERRGRPDGEHRHPPVAELAGAGERVRHLREAAEHFAAAGMEEMSDRVRQQADQMQRELQELQEREARKAARARRVLEPDAGTQLRMEIGALREEVADLKREIRRMNASAGERHPSEKGARIRKENIDRLLEPGKPDKQNKKKPAE